MMREGHGPPGRTVGPLPIDCSGCRKGTAARWGDRYGHAACAAGVVMVVSNSTGVNLPSLS